MITHFKKSVREDKVKLKDYQKYLRKLLKIFVLTQLMVGLVNADDEIPFAGLGFTSELSVAREFAPYTFKYGGLSENSNHPGDIFPSQLDALADGVKLKNGLILSSDQAGSATQGEGLAMALAIETERMTETILSSSEYQLAFELDAQILIFNFSEKSIVASYPLRLTLLNVLDGPATARDRENLARIMFLGDPGQTIFENVTESYLINNFLETVVKITIKPAWRSQIRIKKIEFSDLAKKVIDDHSQNYDRVKQLIASSFASSLSTKLGIPVLPYVKNDAIQNIMPLAFSGTDLINFTIPEANFYVNLKVRGFGKRELRSSERNTVLSFISGVQVAVVDNDFDEIVFERKFQSGNLKNLTKTMSFDLWTEYEISLLSLLDQIVGQILSPDKRWVNERSARDVKTADIVKELKSVKEKVIDKIRG